MTKKYNISLAKAYILKIIFFGLTGFCYIFVQPTSFAQTHEDAWCRVSPLDAVSLSMFYLPDNHPFIDYRLFNSDGNFIEKGMNSFLQIKGSAGVVDHLFFRYRVQLKNLEWINSQRLNISYRNKSVSLLAGLDSIWIGHGQHGSLLLSNNSAPMKLVKFQTEKLFRIPYIGRFSYMIFNGWAENFKVLGQRFGYFPVSWLEFGLNQTVVYTRNYKLWEYLKVLSASQENLQGHYNNDQRASLDVALHLNFLKKITPVTNGKIYFEYAGEDIYAWWQKEDEKWLGPLGFEFFDPGITTGFLVETERTTFKAEYSQNYSIKNIFYSVHTEQFKSYQLYTTKWYRTLPFVNYGYVMGHHMGPEADDMYFEISHRFNIGGVKIFYHKERHGLVSGYGTVYSVSHYPEKVVQIGGEFSYQWNGLNTGLHIIQNYFRNIDRHPDVLEIISQRGSYAQSMIFGLTFSYSIE